MGVGDDDLLERVVQPRNLVTISFLMMRSSICQDLIRQGALLLKAEL
jgi:hypothetical protein